MSNIRLLTLSPAAAPLEVDDLLSEILLRLPPQPSSLPRASLVCKRWRSLVADPGFTRRFRLHHRGNPPLLGCFLGDNRLTFLPTGVWGDLVAAPLPPMAPTSNLHVVVSLAKPAVLVENSLYWILAGDLVGILEFDLDRKNIAVIQLPVDVFTPVDVHTEGKHKYTVMRAEGGGLGFLYFSKSDCIAQLWKRMTHCGGVAFWVLDRTIELDKLLPLNSLVERTHLWILGFAEGNNVVFLWTFKGIFMIHLESLQFKELRGNLDFCNHPFESVYTAGI